MAKQNFRELEMDPLERLYYVRKDCRKKSYDARRRKALSRNGRMKAESCRMDAVSSSAFSPAMKRHVCV